MTPIRRPGQEADAASPNALKWNAAFRSYIPDLKHTSTARLKARRLRDAPTGRTCACVGAKKSRPGPTLDTIMVVSMGEADRSRDPLGDQAMEVTGEWPG